MELRGPSLEEHGLNSGLPAPCRKSSKGIITCMACIGMEQSEMLTALEPEEKNLSLDIIEKLDRAGRHGLSYESFIVSLSGS